MAGARPELFKWKRQSKSSHSSRSGGIQSWIKNVQRASDEAAREVFGEGYNGILNEIHADDDALSEAQDLLDSWVNQKKLQSIQPELEFFDEKWSKHYNVPTSSHTSSSMQDTSPETRFDLHDDNPHRESSKGHLSTGNDFDEDVDEEIAVQEVVRNMLDKKVVQDNVLKDLGFETKKTQFDPRTKMELRHQQVKEKSETRRRDLEKSRREKVARKEAQRLARKQLLKEEKEKLAKVKKEEMMMHKEMARIRKAMEEEQKLKKEQREKEQQLQLQAETLARSELQLQLQLKEQKQREEKQTADEMRKMLLKQMEERAAAETKLNLQLLQKYFSAWYSVLVNQRINLGKAGAMADWKVKLRAWNAWRAYVWHIKSDKEAQAIATEMKEKHKKDQLAYKLYRKNLLHRCFQLWQVFVRHNQQDRELEQKQQDKENKMAAFLHAAASGKLWGHHEIKSNESENISERKSKQRDHMQEQSEMKQSGNYMDDTVKKKHKMSKSEELLVESVEDQELFDTDRQVDELFSKGARRLHINLPNSSRRSCDKILPDHQILPQKPLQNTWCNNPVKKTASKMRPKQRTLSNIDKVEDLRSKLKTQQSKSKPSMQRSQSNNVLEVQSVDAQRKGSEHFAKELNSVNFAWELDSDRSSGSSNLLSREAKIKSEKSTTKPLQLAMEERAKLRAERKALVDEKKRRVEEEKLAKLRLEQQQKEEELMKEKQEALKKKREEKRIEQQREQEKQRRIEELRTLNTRAMEHYRRTLLIKYGLSPWKQLVAMAHQNMLSAVEHHSQALVITCFYPWLQVTRENSRKKNLAADLLYQKILIKRSWMSWKKYGQHMVRLEMVADDYCAAILEKKYFNKWQDYITTEQILYWEKERKADEHSEWRLQKIALTYWKKLIPMAKEEREKEKRRIEMRKRVKAWLPDFQAGEKSSP